ncbi:MAG: hypothetical protein NTV30_10575, partial [Chloroflexi bacterium]|nr:hypothetical protein [Chloroflexota bacterium]
AFVDTIKGFHNSKKHSTLTGWDSRSRRVASLMHATGKMIILPRMNPHSEMLVAALQAYGVNGVVLPEPDDRNLLYSNMVSSGKECLPYRITMGDFIKFYHDNKNNGVDINNVIGFMPSSFGPCRFGKYAVEQMRQLKSMGINLALETSVSNNAYRDLKLGAGFERLAWKGIVAVDFLQRLLWRSRPYEKETGWANTLYDKYMLLIAEKIRSRTKFNNILQQATVDFKEIINPDKPRKPLIGINGEIFLRTNDFSNSHLVDECEKAGLEVVVSPMGEWFKYISIRHNEDAIRDRQIKKLLRGYIKNWIQENDEHSIAKNFIELIDITEPAVKDILQYSRHYLSAKCGSEAVLSIGSGIEWLENPEFAGVISVMPHGCMPGGIVAAMSESFSELFGKPWVNLTYDGFMENTNLAKISNLAEVLKYTYKDTGKAL